MYSMYYMVSSVCVELYCIVWYCIACMYWFDHMYCMYGTYCMISIVFCLFTVCILFYFHV